MNPKSWPQVTLFIFIASFALLLAGCNKEKTDFDEAMEIDTPAAYQYFLDKYPEGEYADKAQAFLAGARNTPKPQAGEGQAKQTAKVPSAKPPKPKGPPKEFTNSIGMEFVYIPAGTFQMGSDKNFDGDAHEDETPQHKVRITKGFYLGKYEVTQEQWMKLISSNPSKFKPRKKPVETVSWEDVQVFIAALNRKENTNRYRLPTEAEWEYACRAGSIGKYAHGDSVDQLAQYAWYGGRLDSGSTHPVGQKQPNSFGLYDMSGNVYEWVRDRYGKKYYQKRIKNDPKGPAGGSYRVIRGGSWDRYPEFLRCARRDAYDPSNSLNYLGFRLLRTAP